MILISVMFHIYTYIYVNAITLQFRFINFKHIEGILPKGPYPPCLRMAYRAFWQDTLDIFDSEYVPILLMWNQ